MRVLIVNTSEMTGGAAVAASRLMDALNNSGVKAKMLVKDKTSDSITVVGLGGRFKQRLRFLWERWCIFCHLRFNRAHLFDIDIANVGNDITCFRLLRYAKSSGAGKQLCGLCTIRGLLQAFVITRAAARRSSVVAITVRYYPAEVARTTCRRKCLPAKRSCIKIVQSILLHAASGSPGRQNRVHY